MRTIFIEAVTLLHDDHQDPAVRDAMAAMLSTALEAGLEVPQHAALVLFRWLVGPGCGRSWTLHDALGRVHDEAVTADAVRVLRRDGTSQEVRDVAFRVVGGPAHAPLLEDDLLLALAQQQERDAEQVARLIEAVHEGRAVNQDVLIQIRDRFVASKVVEARLGSIILASLTTFDVSYWRQVIQDPAARVRADAVSWLAKEGEPQLSIKIITERILIEPVNDVKAEMLLALGKLLLRLEN